MCLCSHIDTHCTKVLITFESATDDVDTNYKLKEECVYAGRRGRSVLLQTNCEPANGFRSSSARHLFLSVRDDAPLKPFFFLLIENISEWKEEDEEEWWISFTPPRRP